MILTIENLVEEIERYGERTYDHEWGSLIGPVRDSRYEYKNCEITVVKCKGEVVNFNITIPRE